MAACTQCTVTMIVNERNLNKRGQVAPLHADCAELEDMLAQTHPADVSRRITIQDSINRLNRKKQGLPVQWP